MDIKIIKEKLQMLKNSDRNLSIFGSTKHQYKSVPVSSKEIRDFEDKFNFSLPQNFREFLLEIGHGAGPYYGILSLKEIEFNSQPLKRNFVEKKFNIFFGSNTEKRITSPSQNFPYNLKDIEEINQSLKTKDYEYVGECALKGWYLCDGCISICEQGCHYTIILVTSGELSGSIWDVECDGENSNFLPAGNSPILPLVRKSFLGEEEFCGLPKRDLELISVKNNPFESWYEKWLDDSLLAMKQFEELNSKEIFYKWKPLNR